MSATIVPLRSARQVDPGYHREASVCGGRVKLTTTTPDGLTVTEWSEAEEAFDWSDMVRECAEDALDATGRHG